MYRKKFLEIHKSYSFKLRTNTNTVALWFAIALLCVCVCVYANATRVDFHLIKLEIGQMHSIYPRFNIVPLGYLVLALNYAILELEC